MFEGHCWQYIVECQKKKRVIVIIIIIILEEQQHAEEKVNILRQKIQYSKSSSLHSCNYITILYFLFLLHLFIFFYECKENWRNVIDKKKSREYRRWLVLVVTNWSHSKVKFPDKIFHRNTPTVNHEMWIFSFFIPFFLFIFFYYFILFFFMCMSINDCAWVFAVISHYFFFLFSSKIISAF